MGTDEIRKPDVLTWAIEWSLVHISVKIDGIRRQLGEELRVFRIGSEEYFEKALYTRTEFIKMKRQCIVFFHNQIEDVTFYIYFLMILCMKFLLRSKTTFETWFCKIHSSFFSWLKIFGSLISSTINSSNVSELTESLAKLKPPFLFLKTHFALFLK